MTLFIILGVLVAAGGATAGWLWFGEDLKQGRLERHRDRRSQTQQAELDRRAESRRAHEAIEAERARVDRRRQEETEAIRLDPLSFLQWSRAVDRDAVELVNRRTIAESRRDAARAEVANMPAQKWTARTRGIVTVGLMWIPITVVTAIMTFVAWLGLAAESASRVWFALLFAPVVAAILIAAGALLEAFHRRRVENESPRDRNRRWAVNLLLGLGALVVAAMAVAVTDMVAQEAVRLFFEQQVTATQAHIDALRKNPTANPVALTAATAQLQSLRARGPQVAQFTAWLYPIVSVVEFITAIYSRQAYRLVRDSIRAGTAARGLKAAEAGVRAADQELQAQARRQTPVLAAQLRAAGLSFDAFNAAVAAANTGAPPSAPAAGGLRAASATSVRSTDPMPVDHPVGAGEGVRPGTPRGTSPVDLVAAEPAPAHRWRSVPL